jgi:transposase-like protein
VLVAWGIDVDGQPVFLGLAPGAAESTDAWWALLADLTDRGLGAPLLVISDGGKGLCAAIQCSFSAHHRVAAAVPSAVACGRQPRRARGPPAVPGRAPQAHPPFQPDRADLWETRRRVKVTGRLPGEQSCLWLVWAVLTGHPRAGAAWP